MKKILLATSAFALMAGAASAEIALSGSARMGLVYFDDGADSSTTFNSRVRIVFTASGETDTGLSFGASVRHDQDDAPCDGYCNGDNTVFISGAFGKLTMGDVSGAADALVGQVSGVGYGPLDAAQEINFIGTNKTAVYYEYSSGAFTFGLGAGQQETARDTLNVGVKYAADGYSVALAWENEDDGVNDNDMVSLGASATFGAATVKARVSDLDVAGADTDVMYALSVDYTAGATTFTAFYTDYGNVENVTTFNANDLVDPASTDTQHIGIGIAYDLGGGATVAGSIISQQNDGIDDAMGADLGLKFSF
ncbi:porin [Rhodobacter sp. SY28-1]|uniref:porin n=1 Tax=Rhodobacter sp. SY28-1 TaxID=2562317 RepID=UPI0014856D51|nr:porin [Rhodobacter sp. SY28-1]